MIGDGGQSGFDVAIPSFRFHTFYDALAGRELQQAATSPTGSGSAIRSSGTRARSSTPRSSATRW